MTLSDKESSNSVLLSVVIPVSGMAGKMQNLERTLNSCFVENVEVILVHDIQDTDTQVELKTLKEKYFYQKIILRSGIWGNPGEARNLGLSEISGKWVVFWDSDDIGHAPQVLEAIRNSGELDNFIVGQFDVVDHKNGSRIAEVSRTKDFIELALNPGLWRIAMRSKITEKIHFPPLRMAEDQVFIARLGMDDSNTQYVDLQFYSYFRNFPNQLTSESSALTQLKSAIELTRRIVILNPTSREKMPQIMLLRQRLTYGKFLFRHSIKLFIQFATKTAIDLYGEPKSGVVRAIKSMVEYQVRRRLRRKRSLTFVVLTGGLGNQLFQMAAAMGLSSADVVVIDCVGHPRAHNGRADLLDFALPNRVSRHSCRKNPKALNRLYNLQLSLGIKDRVFFNKPAVKYFSKRITNILFSIHLKQFVKIVVANGVGYDSSLDILGKKVLIGYFQSYRWSDSLKITNELNQLELLAVDDNPMELALHRDLSPLLVVHIRLGDYRYEKDFGTLDKSYYQTAINLVKSKMEVETIWLFSDEPDLAIQLIPDEFRLQTLIVRDLGMSPAYTLELMRQGNAYVIANSSFSWWGAKLSYDPSPIVCAPKVWFAGSPDPRDITHPQWNRI